VPFASVRATIPARRDQDRQSDSSRPRYYQPGRSYSKPVVSLSNQLVNTRAVDVFAHEVAIAVVFGNYVIAVIEVRGGVAIDCLFDAPAGRVDSTGSPRAYL